MKKRFGIPVVLAMAAIIIVGIVPAFAEERFQTEISISYGRSDFDRDYRAIMPGVSAEVFFTPVQTSEHPYAEAAFLERVGSVSVMAADEDLKSGAVKGDGPMILASINYAKPDFPLVIQAVYGTLKIDYNAPYSATWESNMYRLSLGNYITNTLLAGVSYSSDKGSLSQPGQPTITLKDSQYGFFAKYIYELEHDKGLSFQGSLTNSTSNDGTKSLKNTNEDISADYFFSRGLSAGIGIENSSGKDLDSEGRTYSADIRYFITPSFSVSGMYERFLNANAGYAGSKSFAVMASARF
jgi:hypothetical protein